MGVVRERCIGSLSLCCIEMSCATCPPTKCRQTRKTDDKEGENKLVNRGKFFFYPNPTENAFTIFSKNA